MSSSQAGKWVVRRELLEYLHFQSGLIAKWLEKIEDIELKHKDNLRVANKTLSGERLISLGQAATILSLSLAQTQSILELFQSVCPFQAVLTDYSPNQTGMVNVKVNIHSLALFLVIQLYSKQSLSDKSIQRSDMNKEPWPQHVNIGGQSWSPSNSSDNLFGDLDNQGSSSPRESLRRTSSGGGTMSQKQHFKSQLQNHLNQLSSFEKGFSEFIKKNIAKILQLLQDDTSRHHLSSREFDRLQVLIKEAQSDASQPTTPPDNPLSSAQNSATNISNSANNNKGNTKSNSVSNSNDKESNEHDSEANNELNKVITNEGRTSDKDSSTSKDSLPSSTAKEAPYGQAPHKRADSQHITQNLSAYVPYFVNSSDFNDIPDVIKTIKGQIYVDQKVLERWLGDCLLLDPQSVSHPAPFRQLSMKPPSQDEVGGGISRQWSFGGERSLERGGGLEIHGQIKGTIVRGENDVNMGDLKIIACADCHIYVLAPIRNVQIASCAECVITLGAVGGAFRVDSCERSTFNVSCARILINSCHQCNFQLAVNSLPVIIGDNRNTEIGPYCTRYDNHRAHLQATKIKVNVNYWNEPVEILGNNKVIGKDDAKNKVRQVNQVVAMKPEDVYPFLIPFKGTMGALCGGATSQITERLQSQEKRKYGKSCPNYFPMPPQYDQVIKEKLHRVHKVRQALKLAVLEDQKKKDLQACIMHYFKEWLSNTGKLRLVTDLARLEKEVAQSYQTYFKNDVP